MRYAQLLNINLPTDEPDIKIGSIYIWVQGFTNEIIDGDLAYFKTPTLLDTQNIVVFSKSSETPKFVFRKFLNDVIMMYDSIGSEKSIELSSPDSEFELKLISNKSGSIKLAVTYHCSYAEDGSIRITETIDQSYLVEIINNLKSIFIKYE